VPFIAVMKAVPSPPVTMLLIFLICAAFLVSLRIAFAENNENESDQLLAKIKQTIKQNEECKDGSICKQAAENNLILCPIGSTCVFMTNDFVPYNLATPN
jgi:hypothetical protein